MSPELLHVTEGGKHDQYDPRRCEGLVVPAGMITTNSLGCANCALLIAMPSQGPCPFEEQVNQARSAVLCRLCSAGFHAALAVWTSGPLVFCCWSAFVEPFHLTTRRITFPNPRIMKQTCGTHSLL